MPPTPGIGPETVIGADVSIKGEMSFEGTMRIDGRFDGKLTSKGRLNIGKGAHLAGEVLVGSVSLDGAFKGNIAASDRVELAAGAQMLGDIRAPKLIVAEGATLVGNIAVGPDAHKNAGANEREAILGHSAPAAAAPAPAVRR